MGKTWRRRRVLALCALGLAYGTGQPVVSCFVGFLHSHRPSKGLAVLIGVSWRGQYAGCGDLG